MTKLSLVDLQLDEREREKLLDYLEQERAKVEWTTPLVIPLRSSWWSRLVDWIRSKA
jgi:hypothetical protein